MVGGGSLHRTVRESSSREGDRRCCGTVHLRCPRGQTVCSELMPDAERLKCYDNQAAQGKGKPEERPDEAFPSRTSRPSLMGMRWN